MKKELRVDPWGQRTLSSEEMIAITGGSLTETLVKMAWSACEYFYRMGVSEGKRMKALL